MPRRTLVGDARELRLDNAGLAALCCPFGRHVPVSPCHDGWTLSGGF
jgi:hypothetical protein